MNNRCQAGCKIFTGGEIKHHPDCHYYPESLSKMYDDLLIEVKKLQQHDKARSLLLGLFGVSGSLQPLTVNRVSEMMQQLSKETWVALQGDEHGWIEWWNERNKLNVNSNDR